MSNQNSTEDVLKENKINVLFLTNNTNTDEFYQWLVMEEKAVQQYSDKINLEIVKDINPKYIISYNYSSIIPRDVIDFMEQRIFNLHISFLPWNRGSNPNYWSFIENTPKGVTIHLIDQGLDTGDILVQKELYFDEEVETFKSSYQKLNFEIQKLFMENWKDIKEQRILPRKQESGGSYHNMKMFHEMTNNPVNWDQKIVEYKKCSDIK